MISRKEAKNIEDSILDSIDYRQIGDEKICFVIVSVQLSSKQKLWMKIENEREDVLLQINRNQANQNKE